MKQILNSINWSKVLAVFAGLISSAALIGWLINKPILYSFDSGDISTKSITALCGIIAAYGISFSTKYSRTQIGYILLAVVLSIILQFIAVFIGYSPELYEFEAFINYFPSWYTVLMYTLFGVAILEKDQSVSVSILVMIICIFALVGHAIDVPILYGYIHGISTAMAIPTALSGAILSLAEICKKGNVINVE